VQVPLVVFKREKEVSRSLEFDGMWIAEQPSDDDIRGHWDKLVISTGCFPDKYWDKFVKKKASTPHANIYVYYCAKRRTIRDAILTCAQKPT